MATVQYIATTKFHFGMASVDIKKGEILDIEGENTLIRDDKKYTSQSLSGAIKAGYLVPYNVETAIEHAATPPVPPPPPPIPQVPARVENSGTTEQSRQFSSHVAGQSNVGAVQPKSPFTAHQDINHLFGLPSVQMAVKADKEFDPNRPAGSRKFAVVEANQNETGDVIVVGNKFSKTDVTSPEAESAIAEVDYSGGTEVVTLNKTDGAVVGKIGVNTKKDDKPVEKPKFTPAVKTGLTAANKKAVAPTTTATKPPKPPKSTKDNPGTEPVVKPVAMATKFSTSVKTSVAIAETGNNVRVVPED